MRQAHPVKLSLTWEQYDQASPPKRAVVLRYASETLRPNPQEWELRARLLRDIAPRPSRALPTSPRYGRVRVGPAHDSNTARRAHDQPWGSPATTRFPQGCDEFQMLM